MLRAEIKAKQLFEVAVLAKGRCVCDGHPSEPCSGERDPHHVIPKQLLKAHSSTLNQQEKMEMIWDPRNGLPVCRRHHSLLTVAAWRIHPLRIGREQIEFAREHRLMWALERECPPFREGGVYDVCRTENDEW